jgi:hypothetical protein
VGDPEEIFLEDARYPAEAATRHDHQRQVGKPREIDAHDGIAESVAVGALNLNWDQLRVTLFLSNILLNWVH